MCAESRAGASDRLRYHVLVLYRLEQGLKNTDWKPADLRMIGNVLRTKGRRQRPTAVSSAAIKWHGQGLMILGLKASRSCVGHHSESTDRRDRSLGALVAIRMPTRFTQSAQGSHFQAVHSASSDVTRDSFKTI